jgi:hypothetical protein
VPIQTNCAALRACFLLAGCACGRCPTLDAVEVQAGAADLIGLAGSATEGTVSEQLATRPLLRPAEVLETVPGLIVSQHSGDGKANQYYLRGFNLDHGTDFATWLMGMPVNMPTHAHGQGYTDLNFVIPELVSTLPQGAVFRGGGRFCVGRRRAYRLPAQSGAGFRAGRARRAPLQPPAGRRFAACVGRWAGAARACRGGLQRRAVGRA